MFVTNFHASRVIGFLDSCTLGFAEGFSKRVCGCAYAPARARSHVCVVRVSVSLSLSLSVSLLFAVCLSLMLSRVRTSMLGSTEWFLDCEILKSLNPELYTVFGLEIFPVKYDR